MPIWEYEVFAPSTEGDEQVSGEEFTAILDRLGNERWELVGVTDPVAFDVGRFGSSRCPRLPLQA